MKIFHIIFITGLLFVSACTARTAPPGVSNAELWAEQEKQHKMVAEDKLEKKLNKKAERLKQEERLLKVTSAIMKTGVDMCSAMNFLDDYCVYDFKLLESGPEGAFADGSTIYITPAMMEFAQDDEHLAFIMAHEYSHNMMGHLKKKAFNIMAGAVVGSMIDGLFARSREDTDSTFTKVGAGVGAISFSPSFEAESDYVAMYILARSGYDIAKVPDVWRKMAIKNPDSIFIAITHPTSPERFVAMEKTVREIQQKNLAGKVLLPNIKKEILAKK